MSEQLATIATDKATDTKEGFVIEFKDHNKKINATLLENGLILRAEQPSQYLAEQMIHMNDIIGAQYGPYLEKEWALNSCQNDNKVFNKNTTTNDKDNSAYLYIYVYIKSDISLARERKVYVLHFNAHENYDKNITEAKRWQEAIRAHKFGLVNNTKLKSILIFLNPKSGTGKGRKMFEKFIEPILNEAEISYDLQITTHANFARDFVRQKPNLIENYRGIVVASGDGLFFEVLNGLMERSDCDDVCEKIALGIIPCGSGNGLAKTIAHLYNEPYEPKPILYATLNCVSGKTSPMDIVYIESSNGKSETKMYSFLSVAWGLIADIDIESEFLRSLGGQRFTIWAIRRLINLRKYKGKLSYLPYKQQQNYRKHSHKNNRTIPSLNMALPQDLWRTEEGDFIMVMAVYATHLSDTCFFAPQAQLNDGIIYLVIIRASINRFELLQFLINMDGGTHLPQTPNEHIEVVPVHAFRIEPEGDDGIIAVDGERIEFGPIQAVIKPALINVMVPH